MNQENKLTPNAEAHLLRFYSPFEQGLAAKLLLWLFNDPELLAAQGFVKQEWISVNNQMPEEYMNVIVFTGYYVGVGFFNGNDWYEVYASLVSVTHWMPLPSPPKTDV